MNLVVKQNDIWYPIINFYKKDGEEMEIGINDRVPCDIGFDGKIGCLVPDDYLQAECTRDFTNWPYDIQECFLNLGYSDINDKKVIIGAVSIEIEKEMRSKNGEWKIIEAGLLPGKKESPSTGNYTLVKNIFKIQRHHKHHYPLFIVQSFRKFYKIMNLFSLNNIISIFQSLLLLIYLSFG